jgi:hypothetical protein
LAERKVFYIRRALFGFRIPPPQTPGKEEGSGKDFVVDDERG